MEIHTYLSGKPIDTGLRGDLYRYSFASNSKAKMFSIVLDKSSADPDEMN